MKKILYKNLHFSILKQRNSYLNAPKTISKEMLDYISLKFPKDINILELGSGGGHLSAVLYNKGYKSIFVSDFDEVSLSKIEENYPFLKTLKIDASNIEDLNMRFDLIISNELIEHLYNINQHFKQTLNLLKPGGVYLFKTPNKLYENIYYGLFMKVFKPESYHLWKDTHISLQTTFKLRKTNLQEALSFINIKTMTDSQKEKSINLFGISLGNLINYSLELLFKVVPNFLKPSIVGVIKNEKNI